MKQALILLPILFLVLSTSVKADILLQEDFTASSLPTNWTNSNQQGAVRWLFQNSPILGSPSSNGYTVFDDAALGPGTTPNEASLTTKSINCSNRPNIYVTYSHFWFGVEFTHGYIEVSNDGGSTYTTVFDYHTVTRGSISATQDTTLNISAIAGNQADVKVRFRYTDGGQIGQYWYLDDVIVHTGIDVAITNVVAPEFLECNRQYTNAEPVTVRIFNNNILPVSNVPISCTVSGGTTATFTDTYTGTIPPQSFVDHTFPGTIDMSNEGIYFFDAATNLATDEYTVNDQHLTERWTVITKINLPYSEDFENGRGGWEPQNVASGGFNYGPVPFLSGPAGNGKSIYTDIIEPSVTSSSFISPVFDFSNVTEPHISFDIMHDLFGAGFNISQYVSMRYSLDGGATWTKLGSNIDQNWYTPNHSYWDNTQDPWKRVGRTLCELSGASCVKLQFEFKMKIVDYDMFAFDNIEITDGGADDLHVFQFFPPEAGTCTGFTTTEPLGITLRNNTCRPLTNVEAQINITGPIPLSFTEFIPGPIPSLNYFNHTFTTTADLSAQGTYNLEVILVNNMTGDSTDYYNDTALVNNIITDTRTNGPTSSFPYLADFNTNNEGWVSNATNPIQVMIRDTLKTAGGSEGEGYSWVYERQDDFNNVTIYTWVESPVFDLSATTDPNLYMDLKEFYDTNQNGGWARAESSIDGGNSWQVVGTRAFPNWYNGRIPANTFRDQDTSWHQVQFPLCNYKEPCIQFRVLTYSYGYYYADFAFDNFEIKDEADAGIIEFLDPVDVGCLFSANQQVKVVVYNWSCNPMTNVPVTFNVTGANTATLSGVVPGPIPPMDTIHYTFPGTYDMTPLGYYYLSAQVSGFDSNLRNDTLKETINVTRPKITSYPYYEDFNANDGYWIDTLETANTDFVWGQVPYLNGPQGNGNSWYVEITANNTSRFQIESPVFDLSKISEPYLKMDIKYDLNYFTFRDEYARVEYSINGGYNWSKLGTAADSMWYNNSQYNHWAGYQPDWERKMIDLCNFSGEPCVQFRIVVQGYYSANKYFAVDNFEITDGTGDDLQPMQLILPGSGNCSVGYSTTEGPAVLIRNNFCRPLTNVPVSITMTGPNNQVIQDTIPGPIPRFSYHYYELDGSLDMSLAGEYFFDIETYSNTTGIGTSCINDTFALNNILTENRYYNPVIPIPYVADFEEHTDGWAAVYNNPEFLIIRDTMHALGGAQGNGVSWMLEDVRTDYYGNNYAYLVSPNFDLTGLTNPQLSMDIKFFNSFYRPNMAFQYTLNGGSTWTDLGSSADPTWFNGKGSYTRRWAGTDSTWHRVQYSLCDLQTQSCIKFRMVAYNDNYTRTFEFAMDNFELTDAVDDVSPIALIEPMESGCLYSANQQIKIAVYNWTCTPISDVPVTSTVSGTASGTFTGVATGPIPPGDTVHVFLSGSFDMTPLGAYYFETTTSLATDGVSFNNVLRDTIDVLLPKVGSFPYEIDFDNTGEQWIVVNGVPGRDWVWDSLPYLGGPEGFGKSWYTTNTAGNSTFYLESPVFDLTGITNPYMTFDLKYHLAHGFNGHVVYMQYSIDGGGSWQTLGSATDPYWYSSGSRWGGNGSNFIVDDWTQQSYSLCDLVDENCLKLRIYTDLNNSGSGQIGFDNFKIREIEDVAPLTIIGPVQENCLYTGSDSITVEVYNWSCHTVTNIPVTYDVTGPISSTITENIDSIPAESSMIYTFAQPINLIQVGTYNLSVFTDVSNEINRINDSLNTTLIVDHLTINTFDYLEDFNADSGFGNWIIYNDNQARTFMWGAVPYLGGDEGRGNSWYTSATGNSGGVHYLESTVYDFTSLTNPELFVDLKFDLGTSFFSEHKIQYTIDGGANWTLLGVQEPNWYNRSSGWRDEALTFTNFHTGLCNLIGEPCVKFRVVAQTPSPTTYFAMDNWHITNTTIDLSSKLTYSCSGSQYEMELTVCNRKLSCIPTPIINSFEVGYSVDGSAPIYHSYSGLSLAGDSSSTVIIPNTLIPNTNSEVKVWVFQPNGAFNDQVFENDTITILADQWPDCNDHCSNATMLTIGTTTTSQTANATIEPAEDPPFTNCGAVTIENTVWYSFMTDAQGGMVTVDFENILCTPSANGIQVSIDELTGPPCQAGSLSNIYCNSPVDTVPFGYGPVLLPPNTTYYIVVDGFAGNSCDFDIVLAGAIFDPNPSGNTNVNNNVSCNGDNNGSATVLASNGTLPYTYEWDNGENTPTATSLSAGTHTVTVTEASGNSFTASVQITEPPILSVTTNAGTTAVSCNGESDGSATVSATGGTPSYTYSWDNGETTAMATGLSAGTHTVTVQDTNGCTETATVLITEPTVLSASSISMTAVSCQGESDGTATITATGGTPGYTYLWSNGQNGPAASGLLAGTHSVTVMDANGCTLVENALITEPSAIETSTTVISNVSCNGFDDGSASISVSGGTPGYTYTWDNGETAAMATGLSAGTHTVSVSDVNGCLVIESVVITQTDVLSASSTSTTDVSCNSENDGAATIVITGGTPNYSYSWNNGDTTPTATGLSAGIYSVTVTDMNGCSIVEMVQISEPALLEASITSTSVICHGTNDGTATASVSGGTPGYSYAWDNGETTATAMNLLAGQHTVTIVDMNGCSIVESVMVAVPTDPALFVFFNTDEVSCGSLSDGVATAVPTNGTMPYTYLWDVNAGSQTTSIATGLALGTYMVTITDANGCFLVDGVLIGEEPCDFCQIADDNNTDICVTIAADPNDPLTTLDCDRDGVTNRDECDDTTDPTDPCDFVEGSITLPVTADQSGCLNLCADLTLTTTLIPGNISGASPISIQIDVIELNGVDSDPSPIIIRMPSDPRLTFTWNAAANPSWIYGGDNGLFHIFNFAGNSGVFLGGSTQPILIGIAEGMYDPQGTDGITSISPSIVPFSGGECTINNNTDPESLVYFW